MKYLFTILSIFLNIACGDKKKTEETPPNKTAHMASITNSYGINTAYEISKSHEPFIIMGYFDTDPIIDTAIFIRNKSTKKEALVIKSSESAKNLILENGKNLGADFNDFNWVGEFTVIKKGTQVWNNVVNGEIVGANQVSEHQKFNLKTDGIFVHADEASGGGIIYFSNGKYTWLQQD